MNIMRDFIKHHLKKDYKFCFLLILWIFLSLISLCIGNYNISLKDIFYILFFQDGDEASRNVIFHIRIPRVLISSICGGILAICGVYLQGMFKNPLVDSKIIGVSTACAFGGSLAILLGFSGVILICFSFVFGILSLFALLLIASFVKEYSLFTLILSGIIINGFFGALIGLIQFLADNEEILPNIVFWLMGSFANSDYEKLAILLVASLPFIILLIKLRWNLNTISLDEKSYKDGKKIKILIFISTTALISTQVSISGNIGWIGLIVPHIARFLSSVNHLKSVPYSFVFGMSFMLMVDNISRNLSSNEIPIGIISALIGTPLFAFLLRRSRVVNRG